MFVAISFVSLVAAKTTYEPWYVVKVNVSTPFQVQMMSQYQDAGHHLFFDSLSLKKPLFVGVRDWNVAGFYKNVDEILCADTETVSESLQEWFDNEVIAQPADPMSWDRFHSLDQIYAFLADKAAATPNIVSVFSIGRSHEGREIRGIKIEANPTNPGIFIEANSNGREWVGSAVATWIVNELLVSDDPVIRNLRENVNWYVIPVVNPDGFVYSHDEDRMWTKTRRPTSNSGCPGASIDRNFPLYWSTGGSSKNPCSIQHAGNAALSEVETVSLANFINKNAKKFTAYLNFHSTSQKLMYPFSTKDAFGMRNEDEHIEVGAQMIAALAKRYGTQYEFGDVLNTIYESSGSSIDWVKGVHDIPFVWQYEFRDTDKGFVFPAEQIIANAEETLDSIVALVDAAQSRGYFAAKRVKEEVKKPSLEYMYRGFIRG